MNWIGHRPRICWKIKQVRGRNLAPDIIRQHLLNFQYEDFIAEGLFYTDGSKSLNKTGAGNVRDNPTVSIGLPKDLFIFSAEAHAILRAIMEPALNNLGRIVLSDSESVFTAIESGTSTHPWIQEILITDQKITLCVGFLVTNLVFEAMNSRI